MENRQPLISATLCAPLKRLVWFEKSAHNVPFEEPHLFNATVVRELQSIAVRPAAGEVCNADCSRD